ncbi:MAG: PhoU domain-containing protein [Gammaproteobacteria bacterium]
MDTLDLGHHISKRYNEELEDIRNRVLAMGGLVEQQLQDAMTSLQCQDARLAASVIENDFRVNAMEVSIDEECNLVLGALRLFTQIYGLGQHVRGMVNGALDAFAHLDTAKAVQVWSEDRFVDREYESLMRELMTYMMEDPSSIPSVLQAMFAARAIERIGDRAGNICEYVIYLVKGKDVRHTRVDQQADT